MTAKRTAPDDSEADTIDGAAEGVSDAQGKPTRILLVDDHPIVRRGLAELVDQEPDLEVCGELSTAAEAMGAVDELKPDVMLVDISLRESNGIELTKALTSAYPTACVLIVSMHDEAVYAERALKAGASGYVTKMEAPETILKAIRTVIKGEFYISQTVASRMLKGMLANKDTDKTRYGVDSLSDRELQVFDLIGRGFASREIAEKLNLSVKTVETHRANIKRKLKIQRSTELVRHAIHWVESEGHPLE